MSEREKVLKAFNQCSDALSSLDTKSIMKVFQLLSVQFDIITFPNASDTNESRQSETQNQQFYLETPKTNQEEKVKEPAKSPKEKATSNKKGKSSSAKSPQYLSDFDFRPSGKDSLKDFFNRYDSKSNLEHNLLFTYYLQEIIKVDGITMSHIFSCYRHLGLKIPSFPQTLVDTKSRKGWIETADSDNLKVTREGINHFEHEFKRKDN